MRVQADEQYHYAGHQRVMIRLTRCRGSGSATTMVRAAASMVPEQVPSGSSAAWPPA